MSPQKKQKIRTHSLPKAGKKEKEKKKTEWIYSFEVDINKKNTKGKRGVSFCLDSQVAKSSTSHNR